MLRGVVVSCLWGLLVCACASSPHDLAGAIRAQGYTPLSFPRTDLRPGVIVQIVEYQTFVRPPLDELEHSLKSRSELAHWPDLSTFTSFDAEASASIDGARSYAPIEGALGARGITRFGIDVGEVFISYFDIGELAVWLQSHKELLAQRKVPITLDTFMIVESAGVDYLDVEVREGASSGIGAGVMAADGALAAIGLTLESQSSGTSILRIRPSENGRRATLGYKAVSLKALSTLGPNDELYIETSLTPIESERLTRALAAAPGGAP